MAIVQDWKIRTRSHHCCHTDRPFEDGEDFYTCLFEDPDSEGYLRQDYSLDAWEEIQEQLDPQPFSFWKSTFEIPPAEGKSEAIERHSAESMLRKMIDEDDPGTENARYILAVMLERKKTLKPVETKETETRKLLFYEHKDTGDLFIVADPQLHLSEIQGVQEEVTTLLKGESQANVTNAPPSRAFTIWTSPKLEPSESEAESIEFPPSRAFTLWTGRQV